MASAKISVLEEFIESINCVSVSKDFQSLFLFNKHCFTRSRKLGFDTVTFLILSLLKKSLNIELKTYFSKLNIEEKFKFTKGAFSQRRHQIASRWFKFLLEYLANLYYQSNNNISLWKYYKLLAVDGSSAILIKGEDIETAYSSGKNKYGTYPLCRYMKMFDVLNEITLKTDMLAMNGSERVCAYNWVDSIPDNSITLYDRGFPSFTLFYLMQSCEVPKDFIVRCKKDFSNSIKAFVSSSDVSRKNKILSG